MERSSSTTSVGSDLWYKRAVIYSLGVETFFDSNGDGIGDFPGLTRRLDYLAGLGVTCLWLLPFYPSPNRDHGYDITNYYDVGENFGTLGDFVAFAHKARERGIRVIVDLVVNHTSNEHRWFKEARKDEDSSYRGYYIWRAQAPDDPEKQIVFHDSRKSVWTYDEEAGAYYRHRFYDFEPDLNIANPAVREEIFKIMGFWLELGVSGFRVDAAPFLTGEKGTECPYSQDPHAFIREMRDFLSARRGDAVFIGEVGGTPEQVGTFFGEGHEIQMLFNFLTTSYLFLALAREEARSLARGVKLLPDKPSTGQWANFVRNHDELNLEWLNQDDRREVLDAFAPEKEMRIYGRGIRRRLPTMVGGDRRRMELAYSLLLSLPGTPVVRYGEEIGMGDDLSLPERDSVRTPMQWSPQKNAGFSEAPPKELVRPVISGGEYGYERTNVADQRRDPDSFLNWMERAIRNRMDCPEFGYGEWCVLDADEPRVFAHRCDWRGSTAIAVHNLSGEACEVSLDLGDAKSGSLFEVFGDRQYEPPGGSPVSIRLEGYGYRWFRLGALH